MTSLPGLTTSVAVRVRISPHASVVSSALLEYGRLEQHTDERFAACLRGGRVLCVKYAWLVDGAPAARQAE